MNQKVNKNKKGKFNEIIKRFCRNKIALTGLVIFALILLMGISAGLIYDYDTVVIKQDLNNRLKGPSIEHPLGTDPYGRDMLARLVHGTKLSLIIGIFSVVISFVFGCTIGSVAGYYEGIIDNILMRIMDVFLAIPSILLAIAIVASLGPGTINLIIALSISGIPTFARIVRVSVLSIKGHEFVEASLASGSSDIRIIFEDILPNVIGPVIVQATLQVASMILTAASLSFIGLGVKPPAPEWGAMLSEGRRFMRQNFSIILYPGIFIITTVLALNLLGDGLRDALDPKLKD